MRGIRWATAATAWAALVAAGSVFAQPAPNPWWTGFIGSGRAVSLPDGRSLYLYCEGSGRPVVVMDSGLGDDASSWRTVQDQIAARTRVCVYDRAGYGRSGPGPLPRDTKAEVDDLEQLVKAAKLLSPEGSLAIFGHVPTGLPAPLLDQFRKISLAHTGRWGAPPEAGYLPSGPFKGWFDESGLFGPVDHRCYAWKWRHTTSSYAAFLGTRSEIRMLTQVVRDGLIGDVSKAIDRHGGEFEADYETHLYMARRIDSDSSRSTES